MASRRIHSVGNHDGCQATTPPRIESPRASHRGTVPSTASLCPVTEPHGCPVFNVGGPLDGTPHAMAPDPSDLPIDMRPMMAPMRPPLRRGNLPRAGAQLEPAPGRG